MMPLLGAKLMCAASAAANCTPPAKFQSINGRDRGGGEGQSSAGACGLFNLGCSSNKED